MRRDGRSWWRTSAQPAAGGRWPYFVRAVTSLGVRAVHAFPLGVGTIKLGVLVLYRDQPVALVGEELTESLLLADLVGRLVLGMLAEVISESLAWSLDVSDSRAVVHQATGMISAQLNVGIEEALVRLRGHAFALDQPIDEVALAVVAEELRFDEG